MMINFKVGGLYFCLSEANINRFPNSYFARRLKEKWSTDQSTVVVLNRDGQTFRYVHYFIVSGYLEPQDNPLNTLDALLVVQKEADLFNLPELSELCKKRIQSKMQHLICNLPKSTTALYDCFTECELTMTDTLVQAMHSLRPHNIATHFHGSNFSPDPILIENIANLDPPQSNGYDISQQTLAHTEHIDCCVLSSRVLPYTALLVLLGNLGSWPLNCRKTSTWCKDYTNLIVLKEGASISRRITGDDRYLYIYNSASGGGVVSVSVNGLTVSIQRTGECMALAMGVSYSVSTVTSGVLILAESSAPTGPRGVNYVLWYCEELNEEPIWTFPEGREGDNTDQLLPAVSSNVLSAMHASLDTHKSVALCLNNYYPIRHSDCSKRRFETDPALFTGVDAALYALLSAHFEVDIVTLYVSRSKQLRDIESAAVLDFIATKNNRINKSSHRTTKVVAPMYGCGDMFTIVGHSSVVHKGTTLTALMVSRKKN